MKDIASIKSINQTLTEYEKNFCIHAKLEQSAKKYPNEIALIFGNKTMTYKELNDLSNAFANRLIQLNVTIEDSVIVCLDRSIELIIAIYGILKAGGVYVPLLPAYPEERKKMILADCSPKLIITTEEIAKSFNKDASFFLVDNYLQSENKDITKPEVDVLPTNLAYIIYTSGSTGNPKGVMIEHHSVMNRIGWMQKSYPLQAEDVLIQKTSISFDVSVWELFWWSFAGAKILLLNQGEERDPKQILHQIKKHKVSVIHFVPSMLNMFISYLQSIEDKTALQSLKYIFCSGEALNVNSVKNLHHELMRSNAVSQIVNLYGPTEATVDVSHYLCLGNEVNSIPIGIPIDNTQLFIINEKNEILPVNEKGELIICGVNLARGYLNRQDLTNEKFIQVEVFGELTRAYKTGDIAYWNEKNELIYIGRNDNQIKLRGFRIELTEIEHQLRTFHAISDCSVLVYNQNESNAALMGFFVTKPGCIANDSLIKEYLLKKLPDYMVPSTFFEISELPLTSNGKLNKKALYELIETKSEEKVQKTLGNVEQIIYDIWCQLLNKSQVDYERNFFDLGGNSLLVIQMSILLKKELNVEINIIDLFMYSTIRSLSGFLLEKGL